MSTATPEKYIFFHYYPSLAAAAALAVLFALSSVLHIFQLVKKRTWYFIPFVIGGIFEVLGYLGRVIAARQSPDWTVGPYVMQSLLLLLAPALFAASIYMILGRIIRLVDGDAHSIIRVKWLTKIFVGGDVLSFLAQSAGGGLQAKAKSKDDVKMGENIIVGGLGIQLLFFGFFILVTAIFHYRISRFPTTRSASTSLPWQKYLLVLYLASVLIMVRSMFRIIEYVMGQDGVLLGNEIYLYIFDAALMLITMAAFNWFHPGSVVNKNTFGSFRNQNSESGQQYGEDVEMASDHRDRKSQTLATMRQT